MSSRLLIKRVEKMPRWVQLFAALLFLLPASSNAGHGIGGITVAQLSNAASHAVVSGHSGGSSDWSKMYLVSLVTGEQGYVSTVEVVNGQGKVICTSWLESSGGDFAQIGLPGAYASKARLCKNFSVRKIQNGLLEIVRGNRKAYAKVIQALPVEPLNWSNVNTGKFSVGNVKIGLYDVASIGKIVKETNRYYGASSCETCNIALTEYAVEMGKRVESLYRESATMLAGPSIVGGFNGQAISAAFGTVRYDNAHPTHTEIENILVSRYGSPSMDFKDGSLVWAHDISGNKLNEQELQASCNPVHTSTRFYYMLGGDYNPWGCGLILHIKIHSNRVGGENKRIARAYGYSLYHGYSMALNHFVNRLSFAQYLREEYLGNDRYSP